MVQAVGRLLMTPWELSSWLPPPLFFSPSFCFRCFSTGSCFSGKLSTVSPINYVYFCCLLLHAFSGAVRVPDLLCNMARKYPRICVVLVSFASVCDNQRMVSSGIFAQVWYFCVIVLNCPQHCTFINCRCIFWKPLHCSTSQSDALSCWYFLLHSRCVPAPVSFTRAFHLFITISQVFPLIQQLKTHTLANFHVQKTLETTHNTNQMYTVLFPDQLGYILKRTPPPQPPVLLSLGL